MLKHLTASIEKRSSSRKRKNAEKRNEMKYAKYSSRTLRGKRWRGRATASLICSDGFYIRLYSADNNNGWAKQMRDTLQMCVRVGTVERFDRLDYASTYMISRNF